jgi:hypothetical protein
VKLATVHDYGKDAARLASAIALALVIAWAPYLFFGKTLLAGASDVASLYPTGAQPSADSGYRVFRFNDSGAPGWQNEPWLALQHRLVFDEHVMPLWDPYDGYGVPFAASMIAQPYYPLTFAVSLDPTPWTYNLLVIGRLFIVSLGCALFVRLFAGFTPALIAGICAAFSGYFLLYLDICHVAVEAMLPWTLIGVELVIRKASARSAAVLAVSWALTLIGGMPESAALAGVVVASYAAFRIIVSRADAPVLPRLLGLSSGLCVGTMVAGVMLVPFLEYLGRDFDDHQFASLANGLTFDPFVPWRLLTELAPLAVGPPWNNILTGFAGWSGARGAPGVFAVFFAFVAAVTALLIHRRRMLIDRIVLYMAVVVALLEAKRFGVPFVNWIGALPVLRLVEFTKYEEAPIAVFCAILAGFGVAAILERRVGTRPVILALFVVLGAITWLYEGITVPDTTPHAKLFYAAMAFLLAVFAAAALIAVYAVRRRTANWHAVAASLIALAFIEGTCAFLIPISYFIDKPASGARNPYAGAPYIAYLQRETARDGGRIVATAAELFPDWASAFGLYDTRYLDAMYPQRYLPFVAAFLYSSASDADTEHDRFTGMKTIHFGSQLVRRWMALSSVEYAISSAPVLSSQDDFLAALWAQTGPTIPAALKAAVRLLPVNVAGTVEPTLFEHPPYSGVQYTSKIARVHPWLAVDLTLDPATWNLCGGPVTFRVDALNTIGTVVSSATRTVDPKHDIRDRRWTRLTLDLRREIGRPVTLRFATSVGQPGDACAAWAEWGGPRWTALEDLLPFREAQTSGFERVRNVTDANVYRVTDSLPRLALFHNVQHVANGDQALHAMTGPGFDVRHTAVIEGDAPPVFRDSRLDQVQLITRSSQRVEADVTTSSDALLLQNDTWYPGWEATVDGRESPIFVADYLFRGIGIPAGHHRVVIAYRSNAVTAGSVLSLFGIVLLIGMFLTESLHRRNSQPPIVTSSSNEQIAKVK